MATARFKPVVVANLGGVELFPRESRHDKNRVVFEFDGAAQFVTVPGWVPRGVPFRIELSAIAESHIGGGFPVLIGANSDSDPVLFRNAGNDGHAFRYFDTQGVQVSSSSGDYVVPLGEQETFVVEANEERVEFGHIVVDKAPGSVIQGPIDRIGARLNANYFDGPIWDVKLTDLSPIQNRWVCYGSNGGSRRYVRLVEPFRIEQGSDFEIAFDVIRFDAAGLSNWVIVSDPDNGDECRLLFWNSDSTSPDRVELRMDANSSVWEGALANIAQGQHIHIDVGRRGGVMFLSIDGVDMGPANADRDGGFTVGMIATNKDISGWMPSESAIANLRITDLTESREWFYPLEQAGTELDIGNSKYVLRPEPIAANWGYSRASVAGALFPDTMGGEASGTTQVNIADFQSFGEDWLRINLDNGGVPLPGYSSIEVWLPTLYGDKISFTLDDLSGNGYSYGGEVPNIRKLLANAEAAGRTVTAEVSVKGLTWTALDAPNEGSTQGNYLNLPLYDTTIPNVAGGEVWATMPVFELQLGHAYRYSFDCIRGTGDIPVQYLFGRSDLTSDFVAIDDVDTATPNRVRLRRANQNATWENALAGIAIGEHYTLVIEEDLTDVDAAWLYINGELIGPEAIGRKEAAQFDRMHRLDTGGTPGHVQDGAAFQNMTIEGLTDPSEYVQYRWDEGEGTTIHAYDRQGNVIPEREATMANDTGWVVVPEYTNDGEWTPDTDWQYIAGNNRWYPIDEGEGTVIKNILDESGDTDGTLVGGDSGWTTRRV